MNSTLVLAIVSNCAANSSLSAEYISDCGFPKKSGLAGIYKKVAIDNALINAGYEDIANERLAEQGKAANFQGQSLPWGTWYIPNLVIDHKGKYYLRYYTKSETTASVEYYEEDDTPCSAARVQAIKAYLDSKPKKLIATQAAAGLVRNQVVCKVVEFGNLISLSVSAPSQKAAI